MNDGMGLVTFGKQRGRIQLPSKIADATSALSESEAEVQ